MRAGENLLSISRSRSLAKLREQQPPGAVRASLRNMRMISQSSLERMGRRKSGSPVGGY